MSAPPRIPFEQPDPLRIAPDLRALSAEGTIHRIRTATGDEAWLVTGYDAVRRLLADDRLGRSHRDPENAARTGESALFGGPLDDFDSEHTNQARMRALLQPHFTAKRMRELRPAIDALTTRLLDELSESGPPADLHAMVALPLPVLVICDLLGVPYEDRDHFLALTDAASDTTDRARSEQGLGELYGYGTQLVARKRGTPDDDVISRLCATDGVSDEEVAMLSMGLLFAGYETTAVQLGLSALFLLAEPSRWAALRDDPGLLPNAIEELLRAPGRRGGGVPRYARMDFEIEGVTVREGDLVLLDNHAANHDPAVFAEPDRIDFTRPAIPHLTFGHGLRYCIGAPLARLELHSVLSQLVTRFPSMRLATPVEELRMRRNALGGGLTALPVTWSTQ